MKVRLYSLENKPTDNVAKYYAWCSVNKGTSCIVNGYTAVNAKRAFELADSRKHGSHRKLKDAAVMAKDNSEDTNVTVEFQNSVLRKALNNKKKRLIQSNMLSLTDKIHDLFNPLKTHSKRSRVQIIYPSFTPGTRSTNKAIAAPRSSKLGMTHSLKASKSSLSQFKRLTPIIILANKNL
eukprot:TRINITY_DN17678_c0_g3_i1.p1 TRINITY_DN17678_c0_g3~~TRINITY_DN17678_c0_g3_i1.p1  ORF type:complete len:180 (-),score=3.73 TRINITY_DN17678_c0_g3_i1:139-678(-)